MFRLVHLLPKVIENDLYHIGEALVDILGEIFFFAFAAIFENMHREASGGLVV